MGAINLANINAALASGAGALNNQAAKGGMGNMGRGAPGGEGIDAAKGLVNASIGENKPLAPDDALKAYKEALAKRKESNPIYQMQREKRAEHQAVRDGERAARRAEADERKAAVRAAVDQIISGGRKSVDELRATLPPDIAALLFGTKPEGSTAAAPASQAQTAPHKD